MALLRSVSSRFDPPGRSKMPDSILIQGAHRNLATLLRVFTFAVSSAILIPGCVSGPVKGPKLAGPEAALANRARADWERTCPTLEIPLASDRIIDLYDLYGGWIGLAHVNHVWRAEDLTSLWTPRAPLAEPSPSDRERLVSATLISSAPDVPPHAIRIESPVKELSPEQGGLFFAAFTIRTETMDSPSSRILAVQVLPGSGRSPKTSASSNSGSYYQPAFHPIPHGIHPGITASDGAFAFVSPDPTLRLDPHSLRIIFGNEPIPVSTGNESLGASPSAAPALPVEWIDEERFVVKGLRDLAAYRPSDCRLRLFGRTRDGQWVESSFPFGGELRRLFDPHDAVLYIGLTDRLADGDPELNEPLLTSGGQSPSLDDWLGGDTAGLIHLIQSGYFTTLGATALVLSPPYRQTDTAMSLPAGPSSSPRNVAPYRGLAPVSFAESEPRFGSLDNWAQAIHEAHLVGLSVLFQYCPLLVHETSSLVKEKPDWFADEDNRLNISRASEEQSEFSRADYFAPSLRVLRLARDNTDAVERMTGYGLFWLRVLNADGLQCLASDQVPGVFWKRLLRRVREEIARPEGRGVYLLGEPLNAQRLPYDGSDADLGSLDGGVDLSLALSLRTALAERESSLRELDRAVRDTVRLQGLGFLPCAVTGNADLPRLVSIAGDSPANVSLDSEAGKDAIHRLFFAALLTLPAVPGVYYGDEIGLSGEAIPDNRSMLPSRGDRTAAQRGRYHTVASLAELRAQHPALRRGSYQPLLIEDDVLVFCRAAWKEAVVVALNRGDKPAVVEFNVPANLRSALTLEPLADPGAQTVYLRGGLVNVELPSCSARIWIAR